MIRASSICPSETFIHTEFFDQWIKLYRVPCGAAAVKIFEEHGRLATLSLNYDEQRCERMDKEVGLFLKLLLPHLQRAILLNHQVRAANLTTARFEGLVAAIKWPALIVGLGCRLILANQGAQDALRRARGLILRSNYRLTLKYRADAELFRQLVYAALSPNPGHLTPRSMNFSADGESGPNVLELTPLTRECILVTIRYSDDKLNTDMMLLRDSFRLTAAECEVATKLACGFSLTTIAGDTGRSIHTVRLHLKRALAKTQCHSQAQLVRLLWSLHGTGI
jgi:DNA-binding CsgD family transcriptional regulator